MRLKVTSLGASREVSLCWAQVSRRNLMAQSLSSTHTRPQFLVGVTVDQDK